MSGIVVNEDSSHYYYDRGIEGINEAKMCEMAHHYCTDQTVEVIYNLNAMRSSVDGLPFEPVWFEVEDRGEEGMFYRGKQIPDRTCRWIRSARKGHELGIDPYKVWVDETRRLGRIAGISIRMNDVHCVADEDSFMHSEFWRKHPEFRREQGLFHGEDSSALDYAQSGPERLLIQKPQRERCRCNLGGDPHRGKMIIPPAARRGDCPLAQRPDRRAQKMTRLRFSELCPDMLEKSLNHAIVSAGFDFNNQPR